MHYHQAPFASADENPLAPFRWDYRIIIATADSAQVDDLVSKLGEVKAAIDERHILWFVFDGQSIATNYEQPLGEGFHSAIVRQFFKGLDEEKTGVRLIGKDGGVKEKAKNLNLERLFKLIDSMPKRLIDRILQVETFRVHRGEATLGAGEFDLIARFREDMPRVGHLGKIVAGRGARVCDLIVVRHHDENGILGHAIGAQAEQCADEEK